MSTIITAGEVKATQTQPKRRTLRWIAGVAGGIVLVFAAW